MLRSLHFVGGLWIEGRFRIFTCPLCVCVCVCVRVCACACVRAGVYGVNFLAVCSCGVCVSACQYIYITCPSTRLISRISGEY